MCFFLSLGQPLINRQLVQWESKRKQTNKRLVVYTMLDLYRRRHNFDQNNNSPYRGIRKAKVGEIAPLHVDKMPGKTPQILVDAAQRAGADTRAQSTDPILHRVISRRRTTQVIAHLKSNDKFF